MTATKATRYIAINAYRTSTSDGFDTGWMIYRTTPLRQRRFLTAGLPVKDAEFRDNEGKVEPCWSTFGIRLATTQEIRNYKRNGSDLQI